MSAEQQRHSLRKDVIAKVSHLAGRCRPWFHSPVFGYLASMFLVSAMFLIEEIEQYIPHAPIFTSAPFAIVSILVVLIWGIGPAIFSIVLGLIMIASFLSPGVITADVERDIIVVGPFAALQLIAILVVIRLAGVRRRMLAARHLLQAYVQALETSNQQLLQTNTRLEQANSLREYVLTRAAHELRTPLTTILGRTQLLASRLNKFGQTPENWSAVQKYVGVMEVRARQLRELVEALFHLSQSDTQQTPTPRAPRDVVSLCRKVTEQQRALSGRTITFTSPIEPLLLDADESQLRHVLVRVLDNAIKYSPQGSSISVRAYPEELSVILQVHNESPVLSDEELGHLFDPFYRTPNAEYSSIPGWGLGLTISKKIVEKLGGVIWAESKEESGMTVFVKLPLAPET